MLIQFSVENYKSFGEKQTLEMSAVESLKKAPRNRIVNGVKAVCEDGEKASLLKIAAIYGPNASGKSDLLKVISFMRDFVLDRRDHSDDILSAIPFRFEKEFANKDSSFSIEFIQNGQQYEFLFSVNASKAMITHECLKAMINNRYEFVYERTGSLEKDIYQFSESGLFDIRKETIATWQDITNEKTLFISTVLEKNARDLKLDHLRNLKSWFTNIVSYPSDFLSPSLAKTVKKISATQKMEMIDFLHDFDMGFLHDFYEDDGKIFTIHKCNEGNKVAFSFDEEASGAKALFKYALHWHSILHENKIFFIDEIESSLHPLLVKKLVQMIHNQNSKAQFVFTTHNTDLLNKLARDEVWLMRKDYYYQTELYPLSSFAATFRNPKEAYLNGAFDAVPDIDEA